MEKGLIVKSNNFVEAIYTTTIWEMRLILKMLSLIQKGDADFKEYNIEMTEIKEDFGADNDGSAYERLRDAARSLMKKIIIIKQKLDDGSTEEVEVPIITELTRNTSRSTYIKVSFHPKMKPYLLMLKTEFLAYDAKNVMKLPTPYAIRLYELCRQYRSIGQRTMKLEWLKKILGLEEKYIQYAHLRQRIIEPAVEHINTFTDITVDYEPVKRGRRVDAVVFKIKSKNTIVLENPIEAELLSLGISEVQCKKLISQYSLEEIQSRIQYIKDRVGEGQIIENLAGYLISILGKNISSVKMTDAEITKKVNAILFSRPELQQKINATHGDLSQEAMNAVVKKMFPEKFL